MKYFSIKAGDNAIVQITSNKHDEYTFACHWQVLLHSDTLGWYLVFDIGNTDGCFLHIGHLGSPSQMG